MNPLLRRVELMRHRAAPSVDVVEIRDPTAAGESIEILAQDVVQLESRPLRARRIVVRLEDSLLLFHSTNLRVRARTTLQDGLLAFTVFGPRAKGTLNGLPSGPDLMIAAVSGFPVEIVAEPEYESVAVLLPPAVLESHFIGRKREDKFRSPAGIEAIHTGAIHARALFDWGRRLAHVAARQPAFFDDRKETLVAAQTELLELLLAALDATTARPRTRSDDKLQAHSRIVRLAEEHAVEQTNDYLYVKDLCVATGVSERTLEYAFQEVMGMTPVAFLRRMRLHKVRQSLRGAPPRSTTVSAEALKWGFWHFGEFARAYKECFGELPSETLRRDPG